jgi:tetratricopeptide (TPR) repeat protein
MKNKLFLYLCLMLGSYDAFSQSVGEGIRLYDQEKYISAAAALEKTVGQNPADLNAWFLLARSYSAAAHPGKVIALTDRISPELRNQPGYHLVSGYAALNKGDTVAAQHSFLAALGNARKKDPAIQLAIAQAHIDAEKGNLYTALSLLDAAENRDGKNPAIFLAMGDAYRRLFNGSEAFRNYTRAIELDQRNPVPYYKIGKIYQTQNNVDVYNEYYHKALAVDPAFAPVYFQQYYACYFKDVTKALEPLQQFIRLSDPDIKNNYLLTDLLYINKKYPESISEAKKILAAEKDSVKPRIYKLLAYSYDGTGDSVNAETYITKYFSIAHDSTIAPDDMALRARLLEKRGEDSLALVWHTKAFRLEKDSARKADFTRKLIAFNKARKQYAEQAYWYEQLHGQRVPLSNVDIFNWGVANYNAQLYVMADSVFAMYQQRYPEQTFGYYWRARSNAAIDTAMELGLAVPHYENLVQVAEKDTANANNKKWLIQAYGYIAAYKVNAEKRYDDALAYYDKILALDPGNDDAVKYKDVLSKIIQRQPEEKEQQTEAKVLDKNPPPGK